MDSSTEAKKSNQEWSAITGLIALAIAVAVAFNCFFSSSASIAQQDSVKLPLLVITGVLVLLVGLALISVAFALLKLSDQSEALALPQGSIRAVLALALVLIFAILTVFLYSDLAAQPPGKLSSISGLTSVQAKSLSSTVKVVSELAEQKATDDKSPATFTVYFREAKNPAAEDFAKQVLVMIGTLVTSVTSFYFGSKGAATSTPGADTAKPAPKLTAATPNPLNKTNPAHLQIAGDNLELVNAVKLIKGTYQITADTVTSNANLVKCDFKLEETYPIGAWDVVVTDSNGRQTKLAAGVMLA